MPWTDVNGISSRVLFPAARVDSARRMIAGQRYAGAGRLVVRRAESDLARAEERFDRAACADDARAVRTVAGFEPRACQRFRHGDRCLGRARSCGARPVDIGHGDGLECRRRATERRPVHRSVFGMAGCRRYGGYQCGGPRDADTAGCAARAPRYAQGRVGRGADDAVLFRSAAQGRVVRLEPPRSEVLGEPFEPPRPAAAFDGPAFGARVEREIAFRFNDQGPWRGATAAHHRPADRCETRSENELWSALAPQPRRFTVTVTNGSRDTTAGTVRLVLPDGWPAMAPRRFRLTHQDEERVFIFEVTPRQRYHRRYRAHPRRGGRTPAANGTMSARSWSTIPHPSAFYTRRAEASITVAPVALPKLTRVGYVRGAADRVPEALRNAGVPIALLDADALRRGELSRATMPSSSVLGRTRRIRQ